MKNIFKQPITACLLIFMASLTPSMAQEEASKDSLKTKGTDLTEIISKKDYDDRGKEITYPRTFGGVTFTRIDWGFSRLIDDGGFSLSEDNKFLDYGRASNFGFDIAQFGVRLNDVTKIYLSTGFEWNYLRLKKHIILDTDATPLDYSVSDIEFKKNILTSTYLRIPLSVEFRGKPNRNGDRLKLAVGAMTGILLKGSQRIKHDKSKQRYKDNFNLASFQYGAFARIGFGPMAIFTKYYMNDMFEKSPAQKGLHNFTFGATLGF